MDKEKDPRNNKFEVSHPFHQLHRIIKTPIYFLDETGILNNEKDQYFAIGVTKYYRPHEIQREITQERQRLSINNEEIKWTKMSRRKLPISKRMVDYFFIHPSISFSCIIMKKEDLDFKKYFNNDFFKVYKSFSVILLKMNMSHKTNEVSAVLADNYFCPSDTNLELATRAIVNDHYGKLILSHFIQIDSKSADLLQLTDILLGATLFDLKIKEGLLEKSKKNSKSKLLNHLHSHLSIDESIFKNDDGSDRKIFEKKNKFRVVIFDPKASKEAMEK